MSTPIPDSEATARIDSDLAYTPRSRGPQVQFAPGTMIAGRYRIAGILGSGGMGEVYRADDIKLDQAVALKFLPARLARDPILLERLHDEVRLGRQVAHPNVCRIYDIVDWEGAHFVAMEFVDGEDLSRLLRRIGRLAHDKAVDIARGIAAGLMAAHAKGILHRDLKPANIMIDSRGDSRIMDFGLALAAGEDDGTISGTPAYMAPEQLEGQPATIQSDLYALGLVMYELFTGKRAHNARTMPERVRDITTEITVPSSVIRDLDPVVERIILRCLANDPAQRPRSAREVIESLPGGDPLAAAMAAGETPSPRIVAAAGTAGTLKPAVAWSLLAATVLLLAAMIALHQRSGLMRRAGITRPPAAMADRAESVLREIGVPPARYQTNGYWTVQRYLDWIQANDKSRARWDRLAKGLPAVVFWLREEPGPTIDWAGREARTSPEEPPLTRPGASVIRLDQKGRMVQLDVVPEQSWSAKPLDWKPALAAAGLGGAALQRTEPRLLPKSFADARAAWNTKHPDDATPIRVEAAAWRGTPVFFRIVAPWDEAADARSSVPFGGSAFAIGLLVLFVIVCIVAGFLTWRNLRLRRGDRQGALRLGVAIALLSLLFSMLTADHHLDVGHEAGLAGFAVQHTLWMAGSYWLIYMALEPFMRRRWPDKLISWSRLLAGNWRDPMVGRDVLIGLVAGLIHGVVAMINIGPLVANGMAASNPRTLESASSVIAQQITAIRAGIAVGFELMLLLMVFTIVLRRRSLAVAALWLALFGLWLLASTDPLMIPAFIIITTVYVVTVARVGLLAACVMHFAFMATFLFPLPDDIAWYTAAAISAPLFVLAIAIWAFTRSLGDQKAFSSALLDDPA